MRTDKLITKLNLCESGSTETRAEMLARVFEEPALLTPKTAYEHARDVVKGFWSLGEEVIQESAKWSCEYAKFTKERFFEGEKAIATSARYSYLYAHDVLDGQPFPAGEPAIATSAQWSCRYACWVLDGPFPAGEPAIVTSDWYSFCYAADALDGKPFPAGESMIATCAVSSYQYALDVLHGPFPAGEPVIAKDKAYSELYVDEVLDGDWSRFNRDENR